MIKFIGLKEWTHLQRIKAIESGTVYTEGAFMKFLKKAFLNEKGELSFRKAGSLIAAIGAFSLVIPGAQPISAALGSLGAALIAIGQFDKNDRKEVK